MSTRRHPWLSAHQAINLLVEEHTPYLPKTVAVLDDEGWRDPTLGDQAEDLEWWCDGCHRAAEKCTVMPLLALVHDDWATRARCFLKDNGRRMVTRLFN